MSDQTIVARFDPLAGQWTASFETLPQVAFGGPTEVVATRRLLEGAEASRGMYALSCDAPTPDLSTGLIRDSFIWDPPELLVSCPDCDGRGKYVGFLKVEPCSRCQGRKIVAV